VQPKINMSSRILMETADKALYIAKNKGRNRVERLSIESRSNEP